MYNNSPRFSEYVVLVQSVIKTLHEWTGYKTLQGKRSRWIRVYCKSIVICIFHEKCSQFHVGTLININIINFRLDRYLWMMELAKRLWLVLNQPYKTTKNFTLIPVGVILLKGFVAFLLWFLIFWLWEKSVALICDFT